MDRTKISKILALDPAVSTGYAVGYVGNDSLDIVEYGFIDVDRTDYIGDDCIHLMNRVEEICLKHSIDYVVVEDYFFSSRQKQGSDVNVAFRTAIHIKARQLGIDYTILNISEWKKNVAGRSTPTKEQKFRWGKEPAKKLMIQEALWKNYGFRFPNHSISQNTGKPIKFRYDIVDAVGQLVSFGRQYMDLRSVQLSVPAPPDVDFGKRKIKATFEYTET